MTRFPYVPTVHLPIPGMRVTLHSPDGSVMLPGALAYLDTAADQTVVPFRYLTQLGGSPVANVVVRGFGEAPSHRDLYAIDIELPGVAVVSTRVIGDPDEPVVLVGRDILNLFRVTFDGPRQVTEFH